MDAMIKKRYTKTGLIRLRWCLLPALLLLQTWAWSQAANIQVRVLWVSAHSNVSCDGFLAGNSDFVWEFVATDNTLGRNNNNPSAFGILGNFNHAYVNNNNGPYCFGFVPSLQCNTFISPSSGAGFNPSNGLFFNHDYVCPSDVPTSIRIDWEAYENDEPILNYSATRLLLQGETGPQLLNIPVPTLPGTTGPIVTTAVGAASCAQTYSIAFEVIRTNLMVTPIPDNICDATLLPVDAAVRRFAWCPDATLELGEPNRGKVTQNRSRWFVFQAPTSGRVFINTNHSGTDFGTYFEIYHAADGLGCGSGIQPITGTLIKNKFDYLSYHDFADRGGFLGVSNNADINFNDCGRVLTSNPLVAGQYYYIQMTTDDPNRRGFIEISISSLSGSGAPSYDIPCGAPVVSVGTAVRTFAGGQPHSADLPFSCAAEFETGNFYTGSDPTRFQAYNYNHPATNNGSVDESLWMGFVAPNSGRVYLEGGVRGLFNVNEPENIALFGYDRRFAPGRPGDMLCANLSDISAADGGTGAFGSPLTAVLRESCLEPGYTYYGMVDPASAATGSDAKMWVYDPSVTEPADNAPRNDVLCLALLDTLFRVPVQPFDSSLTFSAVAGTNLRACREYLAGEPASNPDPSRRADQTVWHYFTAPRSGVVDIRLRAYIGMDTLNYAIYPLLNGTGCYGGLAPATYTVDGTRSSLPLTPLASGRTGFNGTTVSLCCLVPNTVYAIQLDGGSPGDQGQYIIEFIEEIQVYAGDSRYIAGTDTINYNSMDTAFVCFGDTIIPGVMLDGLGRSTTVIPGCISVGYVMHNTLPIPSPIANTGFTYVDSVLNGPLRFINNTNGSGSFGNPLFNQVYLVSALADETATWGQLVCESASMENGAPVVFLQPITINSSYDAVNCAINFSVNGGYPGFDGAAVYEYWVVNTLTGDTLVAGTTPRASAVVAAIPAVGTYQITVRDRSACLAQVLVNANACANPCITNPVRLSPRPLNPSIYSCLPGNTAQVSLSVTGGAPTTAGSDYVLVLSGSSVAGQNGTRNQSPIGGPNPTILTFEVADGDNWQLIVRDANGCADTLAGTFVYDQTNCPNFCQLNNLTTVSNYSCLPNRAALVELTLGGGQPALRGTNYEVSISGSTVFGQTFNNIQLAGNINGTVNLSFLVNDGDTWTVIVRDSLCRDTLTATYVFSPANCPNICQLFPVFIQPDPITASVYACQPNGNAVTTVILGGGAPANFGGSYTVSLSGSSVAGQNGTRTAGLGNFVFEVADGDVWTLIVEDANGCADTASGTFLFNLSNCPSICQLLDLQIRNPRYDCLPNGNANLTVDLSGGKPSYNGSNYSITVTGSSAGGNTTGASLAGAIGASVGFSLVVADGDAWTIIVTDEEGCSDTLRGVYQFNVQNCPNFCQLRPIGLSASPYVCNLDGTASFTVAVVGGQPSYDASAYFVTINGSSLGFNALDSAVLGRINDTTFIRLEVRDGDVWQVLVRDSANCTASLGGSFAWNPVTCGNICNDPRYEAIAANGGSGFSYDCDGAGNALVNFTLTGGLPALDGGVSAYTAVIELNGQIEVRSLPSNGSIGSLSLSLESGDQWSLRFFDPAGCDTLVFGPAVFTPVRAIARTDATSPILLGQVASLDGSASTGNIQSYRWTPVDRVDDPTRVLTAVQPVRTTVYTLEVADALGCLDRAEVEVPVGPCIPEHAGFTPNGDGTNDLWDIPCLGIFPGDVEVYNRWGQLVYTKINYDGSWDGTHQSTGQPLPAATYYYVVTVRLVNLAEPVVFKGTVTILR